MVKVMLLDFEDTFYFREVHSAFTLKTRFLRVNKLISQQEAGLFHPAVKPFELPVYEERTVALLMHSCLQHAAVH